MGSAKDKKNAFLRRKQNEHEKGKIIGYNAGYFRNFAGDFIEVAEDDDGEAFLIAEL